MHRYHLHRPLAEPYPQVPPLLGRLREAGYRLFLVTDGHGPAQRHKVAALGLGGWFDAMVFTGELPGQQAKPSPLPFMLACDRLGVVPDRCVYVGDNPACDIQGPRSLGMLTIAVATGPYARRGDPERQPHLRIQALEELAGLLCPAGDPARSLS